MINIRPQYENYSAIFSSLATSTNVYDVTSKKTQILKCRLSTCCIYGITKELNSCIEKCLHYR